MANKQVDDMGRDVDEIIKLVKTESHYSSQSPMSVLVKEIEHLRRVVKKHSGKEETQRSS